MGGRTRRRRFETRRRQAIRLVAVLVVLLGAYSYWAIAVPMGKGQAKVISIASGESAPAVAAQLEKAGLIRSRHAFLAYAYFTRRYGRLQAGGYRLEPDMSAAQILDALYHGTHRAWRWLTLPEGYTVRQIADAVDRAKLATREEFLHATHLRRNPGFPLPETGVEGYLFPDTYRVEWDEHAPELADQMLRQFQRVVWEGLFGGKAEYRGRRVHDIVTLASLVEAEAKHDHERAVIAGVLMNRLRQGRRLECDATVQYALGADRKPRLLYKDLQLESEYNTYRHDGLPPGPICNPGLASLAAAREPANVPYLYYVAKTDGSHVFSTTFAEHTAAIARIRQGAGQ